MKRHGRAGSPRRTAVPINSSLTIAERTAGQAAQRGMQVIHRWRTLAP